ncbi:MAG: serine hydrolase [Verrucomicrobia bacterium]|nr:serine hydrolase [Verrucomicrobiota bacterium]MBU1735436.1 serine hydrolase [Verrucomicrobiota bacterium]MBU1856831.1 serine hydrolase [Verrucomicrobiota bacterium]
MKFLTAFGLGFSALLMAGASICSAVTDPSYTNTIVQMTAYINEQMASNNIPGLSIALVDDQTVVWATGFGSADREGGVAADADTVYHIGSCSKAFLGTAYMQLLDQGRVDIETNLTHYMSEFSMLSNVAPVTIRSLLNHQSGLPGDFFNGMVTTRTLDDYTSWLINCLQNDYPFAPVNERAYYCNSGFVLLSDVVQRITGTNFAEATDAMIFSPLGMDASSFLPDKAAISNRLAAAYNTEGELQPPEILNALGSGSMYSSANDLTKYIKMIMADGQYNGQTLVSSNGIDIMTTAQGTNLPLNVSDSFTGLGWDDVNDYRLRYAGKVSWKDGATYMHSAFLAISRDLKLGVAVIQNTAGSQCDSIGIQALQWAILDKTTTNHWPTNTFVPDASPVTNWPQTNLNALAGLYVGAAGYHKVVAATGTLTLIVNAYSDTPTIFSDLGPRSNGWFSTANSQSNQFAFTNLVEHAMLVLHQVNGAFETVEPLGERYLPGPLSAAWGSRTNRVYRIVNLNPVDYFWEPGQPEKKTLRFTTKDGALMTEWMLGMYVIEPQTNDNLAFQRGTHYRKGGAIQVTTTNGFELLQYSSYRFLDEAAIPTLPVSSITNGSIPFANGTQWYWFTGQIGTTYRARLTAPNQNYFVRITDREGITCSSGTNGPATWICISNGTYAIAVSATNSFAFNLTVCGSRQTQNDYDGDGKADPTVYRDGYWSIYLMAGSVLLNNEGIWGGSDSIPVPGDYDGDGKSDLAVYSADYWSIYSLVNGMILLNGGVWGGADAIPVPGDYDGDGKADLAFYRAGYWSIYSLANGMILLNGGAWGGPDAIPVPGDYDGDGKADLAFYRDGYWSIFSLANGMILLNGGVWGGPDAIPVPGDYDGDGKADLAFYRDGYWSIFSLVNGIILLNGGVWGGTDAIPVPGDYDGDGKADLAFYRDGYWSIFSLANGIVLLNGGVLGGTGWTPLQ